MCRGVRSTTARGTEVVRAPPDPLQVGVEGRTEPGAKLCQGSTEGAGEGQLLLCNGRSGFLEDAVGRAGGYGGGYCGGVEGFDGGFVGVRGKGTVGEVRFNCGKETGLECMFFVTRAGGGGNCCMGRMRRDKGAGQELGR